MTNVGPGRPLEHHRDHRGRRRLAVRARDRDQRAFRASARPAPAPAPARGCRLLGPREPRGSTGGTAVEITTASGASDLVGAMAREHRRARVRAAPSRSARILQVRAGHRDAARHQQPGDVAHARAPDADQVQRRHAAGPGPAASGWSRARARTAATALAGEPVHRGDAPRPGRPAARPRPGVANDERAPRHRRQPVGPVQRARRSAAARLVGRQLVVQHDGRAPGPLQRARVRLLLAGRRVRVRDQHGRDRRTPRSPRPTSAPARATTRSAAAYTSSIRSTNPSMRTRSPRSAPRFARHRRAPGGSPPGARRR